MSSPLQPPPVLAMLCAADVAELHAYFSEIDRRKRGERLRATLARKRDRGEPYARPPFGWRGSEGMYVEDPREQEVLDLIMSMRAKGLTYYRIAKLLNERGHPARGTKWYEQSVRKIVAGVERRAARAS